MTHQFYQPNPDLDPTARWLRELLTAIVLEAGYTVYCVTYRPRPRKEWWQGRGVKLLVDRGLR